MALIDINDVQKVPDEYSGMFCERDSKGRVKKQYWVFGMGLYYRWGDADKVVYSRGKRLGAFRNVKPKLKELLQGVLNGIEKHQDQH